MAARAQTNSAFNKFHELLVFGTHKTHIWLLMIRVMELFVARQEANSNGSALLLPVVARVTLISLVDARLSRRAIGSVLVRVAEFLAV